MKREILSCMLSLLILWPAAPVACAPAGREVLRARLDKREAGVGEPVRLVISGSIPRDAIVTIPETIPGLKNIQIKDRGINVRRGFVIPSSFKAWFVLVGYEPGTHDIPGLAVEIKRPATNKDQTLNTPAFTLKINSLVTGDVSRLDIKDIKGAYLPFPWKMLLLSCLGILSLAGWLIYAHITTRPRLKPVEPPALPAHLIALERIKKLVARDLISQGKVEEFYVELSLIVRRYLEDRFSIRAPEMTTEEFLDYLKDSEALSAGHKQLLKNFLSHCDMVKFARYRPVSDEVTQTLGAAQQLVEETKTP